MSADRITYVGHATVLIELAGTRLLTDPVLRRRVLHIRRRADDPPAEVGERLRRWWGSERYDDEQWYEFEKFKDPAFLRDKANADYLAAVSVPKAPGVTGDVVATTPRVW